MTKANMINAILEEEKNRWNVLVKIKNDYGNGSEEYKRARAKWDSVSTLVNKLGLDGEREARIQAGGYKVPKSWQS